MKHNAKTEWRIRRYTPLITLSAVFVAITLFVYLFSSLSHSKNTTASTGRSNSIIPIEIKKSGLNSIEINQSLSCKLPCYSELEVELLDSNYAHMFSFYKDLWAELHPNDNGGMQVYRDNQMFVIVNVPSAGKYNLRVNSNITTSVNVIVKKRRMGKLIILPLLILFAVIGGALSIYYFNYRTFIEFIDYHKKIRSVKRNKLFKRYLIVGTSLIILVITLNILGYGYVGFGDFFHKQSWFLPAYKVEFLG